MVEDILEGEEVLMGTLLVFGHPVIILFDSGAAQDFMSSTSVHQAIIHD
jgi:hypothetical protein